MKWNVNKNVVHLMGLPQVQTLYHLYLEYPLPRRHQLGGGGGGKKQPKKTTKRNLFTEVQDMKAELAAIGESIGNQHRTTTLDQYRFIINEGHDPEGVQID